MAAADAVAVTVAVIAPAANVAVDVLRTAPVALTTFTLKVPAARPLTLKVPAVVVTVVPTIWPAAFITFTVTPASGPAGPAAVPVMTPINCACARPGDTGVSARSAATTVTARNRFIWFVLSGKCDIDAEDRRTRKTSRRAAA